MHSVACGPHISNRLLLSAPEASVCNAIRRNTFCPCCSPLFPLPQKGKLVCAVLSLALSELQHVTTALLGCRQLGHPSDNSQVGLHQHQRHRDAICPSHRHWWQQPAE